MSAAAKFVEDLFGDRLEGLEDAVALGRDGLEGGFALEVQRSVHLVHRDRGGKIAFVELENVGDALEVEAVLHEVLLEVAKALDVGVHARLLRVGDEHDPVNALQDQFAIEAGSSKPYIVPNYDEESFEAVLQAALELSRALPDSSRTFGKKEEVDPIRHFLGTAFGWGGLPESEAFYLNVEPGLGVGEYKIQVPADVPVDAFWSVSLYNASGFFEPNDRNAYSINSVSGTRNDDGSMTVHLGGCDDDRVNCLPIMEGWNYSVRLYRPRPEILDGSWAFPSVEPVK